MCTTTPRQNVHACGRTVFEDAAAVYDRPHQPTCVHRQAALLPVGGWWWTQDPELARQRWRAAFEAEVIPSLRSFAPSLLLLSAGFDAHKDDPLGYGIACLEAEDYGWAAAQCANVCRQVVSVLEGGYGTEALKECVVHHIHGLRACRGVRQYATAGGIGGVAGV